MPTSFMSALGQGGAAFGQGYQSEIERAKKGQLQNLQYQQAQAQMEQTRMNIDAAKRKQAQEAQAQLVADRYVNSKTMGGGAAGGQMGPTVGAGAALSAMDPLQRARLQSDSVGALQADIAAKVASEAATLDFNRKMQLKDPNEFTMWLSQNPGKGVADYMAAKRERVPVPGVDVPLSPEVLAQQLQKNTALGGNKPLTDAQAKSGTFALRMAGAESANHSLMAGADGEIGTRDDYVPTLEDATLAELPLGNQLISDEYRAYIQGQDDWLSANLRKESGAVIGVEELISERKKYFPQPGDDEKTIRQKAASRAAAGAAMRVSSGRAYGEMKADLGGNPFEGFTVINE